MRRTILVAFLFTFILLSCDEVIEIDDLIRIDEVVPNPINIGDTLNILILNINIPLSVKNIEQVKVLLDKNNKTYTFPATGYYDRLNRKEYGNFNHSKLIDSLAEGYQPIVQCLVDSAYPNQSKIGLQLNEKILNSSIILNITK